MVRRCGLVSGGFARFIGLAVISGLLLAACSSGGAQPSSTVAPSSDGGAQKTSAPKELIMYGSAGAIGDLIVKTILPPFEKANNVKIIYQGMSSAEALSKNIAQKGKPEASLIVANEIAAAVGTKEGIWQKLDPKLVPSLATLPSYAVIENGHSVVTGITPLGLVYNKKVFDEHKWTPPTSWEDLFREELTGHVVIYDLAFALITPVIFSWNTKLGGTYEDLTPVFDKFRKNRSKILTIAPQAAAWDQVFQQGLGWIGVNSLVRTGILRDQGLPLEFVYPKEGAAGISTCAMVPFGAPEAELGQKLLEYLVQPDVQAQYAATQYWAPVNPDTKLDPKVKDFLPDQEQIKKLIFVDTLKLNDNLPKALQQWQRTVVNQ